MRPRPNCSSRTGRSLTPSAGGSTPTKPDAGAHSTAVPSARFISHIVRGLDEDIVVGVLTNSPDVGGASRIADMLYAMVQSQSVIVPSAPIDLDDAALSALAGRYAAGPQRWIDIRASAQSS